MPFKSSKQRAFLYSQHPEIAKRWEKETPKGKKLPKYVSHSKAKEIISKLKPR
jgi:hypothetical protein